jgi:hypothetical protein
VPVNIKINPPVFETIIYHLKEKYDGSWLTNRPDLPKTLIYYACYENPRKDDLTISFSEAETLEIAKKFKNSEITKRAALNLNLDSFNDLYMLFENEDTSSLTLSFPSIDLKIHLSFYFVSSERTPQSPYIYRTRIIKASSNKRDLPPEIIHLLKCASTSDVFFTEHRNKILCIGSLLLAIFMYKEFIN